MCPYTIFLLLYIVFLWNVQLSIDPSKHNKYIYMYMYVYIYVCIGIFHGNYVIVCDTYHSVIHIRFYMLFGNDVSFAILSIVAQYIAKELSAIHRK